MTSLEQEELVSLIFGPDCEPPPDWRDNPEFAIYLAELGNLGPDRIVVEPERVAEELSQVQSHTQELAFSNYKTFIQTSRCSQEIFTDFTKTEEHLDSLLSQLPTFREQCAEFQNSASEISSHRRLTSLTLAKHTSLLEVLELPQLMETVVRNHHYEEALELRAYTARLVKKQPGVAILEDISRNISNSMKLMLNQLLAQLRSPVQLPQCLKVISYLRRMDVFGETELRLKFLQARETWLNSVVGALPRDDPYTHLTRTMELMRVHLFDIVTQYRAIFSDKEGVGLRGEAAGTDNFDNRLLFTSWLDKKVRGFLSVVEQDLASPGVSSFESILGQAMYFGLSFSRVGFDFRPLLGPIFLAAIERQFQAKLSPASCLKTLSDHLATLTLARLPVSPPLGGGEDSLQPPLSLMDFPPLAHLTNSVLSALNEVRLCAPLTLAPQVTLALEDLMHQATLTLLNFHSTASPGWGLKDHTGWEHLCSATSSIVLPYLQRCLSAMFPLADLTSTTGMSRDVLAGMRVGLMDREKILEPIKGFLPVLEPSVVIVTEGTEYVADKMEEIASALDKSELDEVAEIENPGFTSSEDPETVESNIEKAIASSSKNAENTDIETLNKEELSQATVSEHIINEEQLSEETVTEDIGNQDGLAEVKVSEDTILKGGLSEVTVSEDILSKEESSVVGMEDNNIKQELSELIHPEDTFNEEASEMIVLEDPIIKEEPSEVTVPEDTLQNSGDSFEVDIIVEESAE